MNVNLQHILLWVNWAFLVQPALSCDPGWVETEGKCLYFSAQKLSFHESAAYCTANSGRLIEVKNQQALTTVVATSSLNDFWIGISDQRNEGSFVFNSSGAEIKTGFWQYTPSQQPDNLNDLEDCVSVRDGKWLDEYCNIAKLFICEDLQDDLLFWRACPIGWNLIDRRCYHKAATKMSLSDATAYCDSQGGQVIEPRYHKVSSDVSSFYFSSSSFNFWIGVTDAENEGLFKYLSSNDPVGYTNWGPENEPDNAALAQHCVASNGAWADYECSQTFDVVCEEKRRPGCPVDQPGYHFVHGRCFYYSSIPKAYVNASIECLDLGGRLYEPKNRYSNKQLRSALNDIGYYIGINDMAHVITASGVGQNGSSSDFVYATSAKPLAYSQWAVGQPFKENTQANCVIVANENAEWDDIHCLTQKKFVCELAGEMYHSYWDRGPIDSEKDTLRNYLFQKLLSFTPDPLAVTEAIAPSTKILVIGGRKLTVNNNPEVYLLDIAAQQFCIHSTLPLAFKEALVHEFRNRLLVCSTAANNFLECFIWGSHGWEPFFTPTNNLRTFISSVTIPGVGIWFVSDSESLLLSEETGEWSDSAPMWTRPRSRSCMVQINENVTAVIGGQGNGDIIGSDIDTYNWVTGVEKTKVTTMSFDRKQHSCALIPKGLNGNPTVAILGDNSDPLPFQMELWDTVTNEIILVDHPPTLMDQTLFRPDIVTFDDESILFVAGDLPISSSYVQSVYKYTIYEGWTLVLDSPTPLNEMEQVGLYLINDPAIENYDALLTCAS